MIAGKLDRYITIEQAVYTADTTTGERQVDSWSTYKSVWAKKLQPMSMERVEGDQIALVDTYNYTIRYYDAPSVTARMRILDESEYYDIIGIKELGRRDGLLIIAAKRDN